MKEFIRQVRLWRIRRKISQAIRRIKAAEKVVPPLSIGVYFLNEAERRLRACRKEFNP